MAMSACAWATARTSIGTLATAEPSPATSGLATTIVSNCVIRSDLAASRLLIAPHRCDTFTPCTPPREMRNMADLSTQPKLTPEQRRAAAGQFERANQVLKAGDHEYGLRLLLECCKIDPASLIYRQALRQG